MLGLSYGQAAGAITANFPVRYRYTGAVCSLAALSLNRMLDIRD